MANILSTPFLMRNRRTAALWRVTYDYGLHLYHFEPCGNLALIREPVDLRSMPEKFELVGSMAGCGYTRLQERKRAGIHRQNHTRPVVQRKVTQPVGEVSRPI